MLHQFKTGSIRYLSLLRLYAWDCNEINTLNEFESILNEISALCITNNIEHLCLLGDMNTDFSPKQS